MRNALVRSSEQTAAPVIGFDEQFAHMDRRMVSVARFAIAIAGLVAIAIDPTQPDHFVAATYAVLSAYVVYSAIVYAIASTSASARQFLYAYEYWVDIAWYAALVNLSSGTSSIFFFGFLFAILIAAFYRGLVAAYAATLVSFVLFSLSGLVAQASAHGSDLNQFLVRVAVLICFGFLAGQWGARKTLLQRQLEFLGHIGPTCNPRLGCDRTIGTILEGVRVLYDADECTLISRDRATGLYEARQASRTRALAAVLPQSLDQSHGDLLLAMPDGMVQDHVIGLGVTLQSTVDDARREIDSTRLGIRKYRSLLHAGRGRTLIATAPDGADRTSRVLLRRVRRPLGDEDGAFVRQVFERLRPVTDTIRLIDRLVLDARGEERERIARDVHDVLIQPLVAVRMGLTGIVTDTDDGDPSTWRTRVAALEDIAGCAIADLREYTAGLRGRGIVDTVDLLDSIRTLARRVERATGMRVDVVADDRLVVAGGLAQETHKIIWEGLSNAWRHASSVTARVNLAAMNGFLSIEIENEDENENHPDDVDPHFTPHSISERAHALGGTVHVRNGGGSTVVSVQVPL